MDEPSSTETKAKPGPLLLRRTAAIFLVIVIIGGAAMLLLITLRHGPVPRNVQKQVNFHVFYPAQSKLPSGYSLNKGSFRSPESNVVLFSISYGNGRSLVFSETAKPSGDVIDKFNASAIPVHTQVGTAFGKALVGAYGSGKDLRTIASLPIDNGPWLIVTAPSDINQGDLQKVLQAISK